MYNKIYDGGVLADWTRQQHEMASRVVHTDKVPWRLDETEPGPQLERIGGLDISFQEEQLQAPPPQRQVQRELESGVVDGENANAAVAVHPRQLDCAGCVSAPEDAPAAVPTVTSLGPGVAALVVLSYPDMRLLYEDYEPVDLTIPYLPGFLGFREAAAYSRLLQRAESSPHRPQVLLVDGCGTLHPRACGSACQVGVTCGYPTVGVAKNLLVVDGLDKMAVRAQLQQAAAEVAEEAAAGRFVCVRGLIEDDGRVTHSSEPAAPPPPSSTEEGSSVAAIATAAEEDRGSDYSDAGVAGMGGGATSVVNGGHSSSAAVSLAAAAAAVPERNGGGARAAAGSGPRHHTQAAAVIGAEAAGTVLAATHASKGTAASGMAEAGTAAAGATAAAAAAEAEAKARTAAVVDVQVPLRGASGWVLGTAMCPGRTKKPLYISVGHRLSLATATELVRRCCLHRIPEPIRQADLRSRQWLRTHCPGSAPAVQQQ